MDNRYAWIGMTCIHLQLLMVVWSFYILNNHLYILNNHLAQIEKLLNFILSAIYNQTTGV